MIYPNPFDFDRSGDLGFTERAYENEFLSGYFDADQDAFLDDRDGEDDD